MLRRLSTAVSGGLRRSLSTGPSRPPWALIQLTDVDRSGSPAPAASFHLDEPPFPTSITVPANFIHPRPLPDPATGKYGFVSGDACAASTDGLLLLRFSEAFFDVPAIGGSMRDLSWSRMDLFPETTRFVCNPLSGELYRLPDLDGTKRNSIHHHLGLLTHSDDGGRGPPDRYAVAEMFTTGSTDEECFVMRRFLSDTGRWDKVAGMPSPVPAGRRMRITNAVAPFGDRLWWVDESWGAVSVDPLSERPELRFVELPRGSVLPDLEGIVLMRTLHRYRRVGVSEGKLRYVEVSKEKPHVISFFSLDDGGGSWTLDQEVAFTTLHGDEHHWAVPLQKMPAVGAIHPLNANIVYLIGGDQLLVVDMVKEKVTGSCRLAIPDPDVPFLPCVLPAWLESSHIPSAGWSKKFTVKREASQDTSEKGTSPDTVSCRNRSDEVKCGS